MATGAKQKSNKAAQKRFFETGSGKLKRAQSGKAHMAKSKRRKNIRNLNKTTFVFEGEEKTAKQLIQGGKR